MTRRLGLAAIWLLCLAAAMVSLVWMAAAIIAGSGRAWRLAVGFDQMANTAAGGDEDETISSRAWRYRAEQPYRALQAVVDWAAALAGEPDHCRAAYEMELAKARGRLVASMTIEKRSV